MSFTLPVNYNDPDDLIFNQDEVDVEPVNGMSLKIVDTPFAWNEPFDDNAGFNWDDLKAEFVTGQVQALAQIENYMAYFKWSDIFDFNFKKQSITATHTLNGDPVIAGGAAVLTGNDQIFVNKDTVAIAKGAIRFFYSSAEGGTPVNNHLPFSSTGAATQNRMDISHTAGGVISIAVYDSAGALVFVHSLDISAWGIEFHEIEINYKTSAVADGFVNFILDGDLEKVESNLTWERNGSFNDSKIGGGATSNFSIKQLYFSEEVLHESSYPAGSFSIPDFIYATSKVDLPAREYTGKESIQEYGVINFTGASTRVILNDKYYDGANWVNSDGTESQANTITEYNDNRTTAPVVNTMAVSLVFEQSNIRGVAADLVFNYTGLEYPLYSVITVNTLFVTTALIEMFEKVELNGGISTRVIALNQINYYYDGAAWVPSDLTPGQSNTIAEINANAETLPISGSAALAYHVILQPAPDNTPVLKVDYITFGFMTPGVYEPGKAVLYGFLRTISGFPTEAQNIRLEASIKDSYFTTGVLIMPSESDAEIYNGKTYRYDFAWSLYESETANELYTFRGHYTDSTGVAKNFLIGKAPVPNAPLVNIADLVFVKTT